MYQFDRRCLALCLAAASGACSAAQMQQSRLVEVQSSVRAAERAGAAEDPRGARLLESARRSLMRSVSVANNGDEVNAELFLERAEVDAELALQLARANEEANQTGEAWTEKKP